MLEPVAGSDPNAVNMMLRAGTFFQMDWSDGAIARPFFTDAVLGLVTKKRELQTAYYSRCRAD